MPSRCWTKSTATPRLLQIIQETHRAGFCFVFSPYQLFLSLHWSSSRLVAFNFLRCPASANQRFTQPEYFAASSIAPLISTPALELLRSRIHHRTTKAKNTLGVSKKSSSNLRHDTHQWGPRKRSNQVVTPNSQEDFLNRLRTFKLTTYPAGKPRFLSPPTMSSFGWTSVAKSRLKCQTCQSSWVLAVPSNLDWRSTSGIQLGELGKRMRIDQHRPSCAWRNRRSPSSIFRPPRWKNCKDSVEAFIQIARDISHSFFASGSTNLQPNFRVDHSLPEQSLTALSIVLQSGNQQGSDQESSSCLTLEPFILALFGWSAKSLLERPAECAQPKGPTTRSSPVAPSFLSALPSISAPSSTTTSTKQPEELKVLCCKLCHRQALPSANTTKAFNPITEHREYCPFVDKFCGFEEEYEEELQPKNPGWEHNLQIIENFIHRMNQSNHDKLDKSNCFTLENIANQFSSSYSVQSNHGSLVRSLSSARSQEGLHRPTNLDSSPHIALLNFVKAVLTVPSTSFKSHS